MQASTPWGAVISRSLDHVELFQGFSLDERRAIEAVCVWRRYRPGEAIAAAQDQSREVFFLTAGVAKAYMASAAGVVVAFGDLSPGSMFGEIAAIDGQPRHLEVEAVSVCTVARLQHKEFIRLIEERPGFAMAVLTQIASNLRRLAGRIYEYSTLPVRNRVHAELLRLVAHSANGARGSSPPSKANAIILSPAPKHAAMAARISTHREAVTRELNVLVKDGVLKKAGADLVVCDVERLRQLLDHAMAQGIK